MVKFRFYDPDDKPTSVTPAPSDAPSAVSAAEPERTVPVQVMPSPPKGVVAHRNSGFTLHWVHQLHWHKNPFTELTPKPAHVFVVNQDAARQHINLFFIKEKQFGTLSGAKGMGKTFMLTWLAEELQPYGDRFLVFGFEGSTPLPMILQKLVSPHEGLLAKYKGNSPEELSIFLSARAKRRIVILVDNADSLPDQTAVYYKQLLAHNNAIVILAGQNPPKLAHDDLQAELEPLKSHDVVKLLERRIAAVGGAGTQPFPTQLIEELWRASDRNLKQFIDYCNETAMKVALKQFVVPEEPAAAEPAAPEKKSGAKPVKKTASKPEPKKQSPYDDLIAGLAK